MEILLIEGDPSTARFLTRGLAAEGFRVAHSEDGRAALERALQHRFDLVLLDLVLQSLDAFSVLRVLHAARPDLPVILLARRSDLSTKLRGFRLGAADFVEKPCSLDELVARLRVHLRGHAARDDGKVLTIGRLALDLTRHQARVGDHVIQLTGRENQLLSLLLEGRGEVVSRERLLSGVWGYDYHPRSNVVDVCIGRLRKKLGPEAPIETVRRTGYRLSSA
jgi:two-component system copper resistance phosphate regulon response regulator CusR